ncbi:MAG: hypothetical protein ACRD1R_05870, partial [Acidobacteriota bacterium]
MRELPEGFQQLPPEMRTEIQTFAQSWDGGSKSLNDFAKEIQGNWNVPPGETKGIVKDLATVQQPQPGTPNFNSTPWSPNAGVWNANQSLNLGNINQGSYY